MGRGEWNSNEVLAWTEREGPGRPPAGPRRSLSVGLAATLGVVFAGMISTDKLCPEHRAWVQALGSVAMIGVLVAAIGLFRQWAVAPFLTLVSSLAGVGIGFIDAVHSPTRGQLIAIAFAAVSVGALWLALRQVPLIRWDRSVRRGLRSVAVDLPSEGAPTPASPAEEPEVPARLV
jgi:hypothetical protein